MKIFLLDKIKLIIIEAWSKPVAGEETISNVWLQTS